MFKWFKGKDSDVKTLEKELASIASKINKHEASISKSRSNARRYKGAITLYGVVIYTIYLALWFLLFARDTAHKQKWLLETLPILVGPVVIYLLRNTVSGYYDRAVKNEEAILESLKTQQKEKVEEFKTKTDFYTTKSLIDRYSGSDITKTKTDSHPKDTQSPNVTPQGSPAALQQRKQRLQDVQNRQSPRLLVQSQMTPQQNQTALVGTVPTPTNLSGTPQFKIDPPKSAEFAPNAEAPQAQGERHWYDRILDVIVGEDEGNDSSKYKMEQKIRMRDETIAGLEVELMKLRKLVHSGEEKSESPVDESREVQMDKLSGDIATTALPSNKGVRTRKTTRKSARENDNGTDDEH